MSGNLLPRNSCGQLMSPIVRSRRCRTRWLAGRASRVELNTCPLPSHSPFTFSGPLAHTRISNRLSHSAEYPHGSSCAAGRLPIIHIIQLQNVYHWRPSTFQIVHLTHSNKQSSIPCIFSSVFLSIQIILYPLDLTCYAVFLSVVGFVVKIISNKIGLYTHFLS